MMNVFGTRVAIILTYTLFSASAYGLPVIPGGKGFGIETPAGRGGDVYRVTNLAASGPGSLEACTSASGPRVCVFEVSGTIVLPKVLSVWNPYLTIAGQTAPEPGIMIRGAALGIYTSDVLVQHIAFRAGDSLSGPDVDNRDALKIGAPPNTSIRNVIIDHCSISWGLDENLDLFTIFDDITISNTIISEPLYDSLVNGGTANAGYNSIIAATSGKVSYINNLFAHAADRNPLTNATDFVFVNNVIYNRRYRGVYVDNNYGVTSFNSIVGNVFVEGPDWAGGDSGDVYLGGVFVFSPTWTHPGVLFGTKVYVFDNLSERTTADPWSVVSNKTVHSRADLEAPGPRVWPNGFAAMSTANDAVLDNVLNNAGSRPASRNAVDARVVADVRNGTGQIINCVSSDGSQRCARNAGGWPQLQQNTRTLNVPANPGGDDDGDGYTNLEEWLHTFSAEVEVGGGTVPAVRPNPPTLSP